VGIFLSGDLDMNDALVETEAAMQSTGDGVGLICRLDPVTQSFIAGGASGDGSWSIIRATGDEVITLAEGQASDLIKPGVPTRFGLDCRGQSLTLQVNYQEVGRAYQATVTPGNVGLMATNDSENGGAVAFDEYDVYAYVDPAYFGPFSYSDLPFAVEGLQVDLGQASVSQGTYAVPVILSNTSDRPWTVDPNSDVRIENDERFVWPISAATSSYSDALGTVMLLPGETISGVVYFLGLDVGADMQFVLNLAPRGYGEVRIRLPSE
jgi:hypothetical protein